MSLIRLHDVSVRFENTPVLREVFFRLEAGDRVGLIGRNGSGKTTLLKLALAQVEADTGTVTIDPGTKIGYFSQFSELDGGATIVEVLEGLFEEIRGIEAELAQIDAEVAVVAVDENRMDELTTLIERQAVLFEEMDRLDGWDYPRRIDTALTTLGFEAAHRTSPIDDLSGGWRNRAALAKILLEDPDVLLLDEPTNFLDVAGVEWLESWFRDFKGAAIVVSHDRGFLDAVATRILEVENFHLHEYPGNFAEYVVQKQFRLKTLEQQFVHESELLAFEAEGISDRREAAKAASRGLDKQLSKIKKARAPRPVDQIITEIYGGLHVKDVLCRVDGLEKSYGDRTLFEGLSFEVRRGNRVVVVGANGSGKSTLLRVLAGEERQDAGTVAWASGAKVVSYNEVLDALDQDDTVTHAVNAMPDSLALTATRKSVGRFLAMFQFSDADLQKRIRDLSGGQRARVAMAQCLLSGASVLLLDEPTNHLDLASTQVMERALVHFPGAVIVVSHDRFFSDKVANRKLVFSGGAEIEVSAA
ncbi:MAG: transporter [Frondihabitans sp.]|nr:transporter [Frondihabitans sp.]